MCACLHGSMCACVHACMCRVNSRRFPEFVSRLGVNLRTKVLEEGPLFVHLSTPEGVLAAPYKYHISLGYWRGENAVELSDEEWHDLWDVDGVRTVFPVWYIADSCVALLKPDHFILEHPVVMKCHAQDWHNNYSVSM